MTKRRQSIPAVKTGTIEKSVEAIKRNQEIDNGERGDPEDSRPTIRQLKDWGLVNVERYTQAGKTKIRVTKA